MGLRPAKCYKYLEKPYTRQSRRKPKKSYVKGVPYPKITRFEFGKKNKEYSAELSLVVKHSVQIRSNALEAMRVAANKKLSVGVGEENYFLKVLVFPYHVLRENAMATGAGADRYQTGMSLSFGKPIGTAARVMGNQEILKIYVDKSRIDVAKEALRIAKSKIPMTSYIKEKIVA
jgi:large subunit ribosomal protein L10e